MLDDRKFYFSISSKEPEAQARQGGGFPDRQLRKWRPIGPDEAVVMDKENPFVGDQSPCIQLDSSTPHGIEQSGLALVKGKKYAGRIYLRGTPGTKVKVTLIWGDGASDRQTISIPTVSGTYKNFPLRFTANADTDKAALEITGNGHGELSHWYGFIDACGQCTRVSARHNRAPASAPLGLLALARREFSFRLELV
jgi:alpha-L-arabinofuranosidase